MSDSVIRTTNYDKFREGACSNLDASGNPTPDIAAGDVSEGTWFFSLTGPDPVDNGTGVTTTFHSVNMWFRSESGVWVWKSGSFRASNTNGHYSRAADGTQECKSWGISNFALTDVTWTYPAAFSSWDWVNAVTRRNDGLQADAEVDSDALTATSALFKRYTRDSTLAGLAIGRWN